MGTKNLRHGQIRVEDGTPVTPLARTLAFTDGDFSFSKTKNINIILDRGKLSHPMQGDQQPIDWSLTAKFVNRTIAQLFDEMIFDTFAELITGLTPAASNPNTPTTHAFRQGSLIITDGAPFTGNKLAVAVVPTADGEHSENLGVEDVEGVIVVPAAAAFDVFPEAANTDVNITYDAVGITTLVIANCPIDVKTLDLKFDVLDPSDLVTVLETYELDAAYLTEPAFEEGDEMNTWTLTGQAFIRTVATSQQVTP